MEMSAGAYNANMMSIQNIGFYELQNMSLVDCWWNKSRYGGIDIEKGWLNEGSNNIWCDFKTNTSNGKYYNLISWVYTMGFTEFKYWEDK